MCGIWNEGCERNSRKRYQTVSFTHYFGGRTPSKVAGKHWTDLIIFLYWVMFSGSKMLAIYEPNSIQPHVVKHIFLTCVSLHKIWLSLHPRFMLQLVIEKEQVRAFLWDSWLPQVCHKPQVWDLVTSPPRQKKYITDIVKIEYLFYFIPNKEHRYW